MQEKSQLCYYKWQGIDQNGHFVSDRQLALSQFEIEKQLQQQHIQIIDLHKQYTWWFERHAQRLSSKDITSFTQQIATMLTAGIAVTDTFKLLIHSAQKSEEKSILTHIGWSIESGSNITQAFAQFPQHFSDFYLQIIANGEQSGQLDQSFQRLALHRDKQHALNKKIMLAIQYPMIVLLVSMILSAFILIFVIPEFNNLFSQFGAQLPMLTQWVVACSNFLIKYFFLLVALLFVVTISIKKCHQSSRACRYLASKWVLKLPGIGTIQHKAAIARFCRTFSHSFQSGVPLVPCLNMAINTMNQHYYQTKMSDISTLVSSGSPIHLALSQTDCFSDLVIQMIMIGEESGTVENMLERISNIYEEEVDQLVNNLGQIFEPLMMLVLGGILAVLIIAMYLPIFDLIQVLG